MENKIEVPMELLELAAGGRTLPDNWEEIADSLAPQYQKMYKDITYEQACMMVKQLLPDPEDQELLFEYLKKYFPEA